MNMKATIIATMDAGNKRKVKGFGILEIDGDLLERQQGQPLDVTRNCRESLPGWSLDILEMGAFDLEGEDADAATEDDTPKLWAFRGHLVKVEGIFRTNEERALLVKEAVWKREKRLDKLVSLERVDEALKDRPGREAIPEKVKVLVWQRAKGRCQKCGSNAKLEYDHIIPISKGGSNTDRNLQILCEFCNRSKGATIE